MSCGALHFFTQPQQIHAVVFATLKPFKAVRKYQNMRIYEDVIEILAKLLDRSPDSLNMNSKLLGHMPEFDSMLMMQLLVSLDDHFQLSLPVEKLTAEQFNDVRSLCDLIAEYRFTTTR